jgi:jumonji domain-containing protein 7
MATEEKVKSACIEARDLYIGYAVPEVSGRTFEDSPLAFYRDYVSQNRPCLVKGAADDWPCLHKWDNDYLISRLGNQQISVAYTPNGRADAVTEIKGKRWFCEPETRSCKIDEFIKQLAQARAGDCRAGIPYIQLQNNSLRLKSEFSALEEDVGHLPWANSCLGEPEAVNVWVGSELSSTSYHCDNYENMYLVVSGEKHFTLLPPHEGRHRLHEEDVPSARFKRNSNTSEYDVEADGNTISWSALDLEEPDKQRFPRYFDDSWPAPLKCTVKKGDILYLPALWYHWVGQSCDSQGRCLAVNFWHDFSHGPSFLAKSLAEILL